MFEIRIVDSQHSYVFQHAILSLKRMNTVAKSMLLSVSLLFLPGGICKGGNGPVRVINCWNIYSQEKTQMFRVRGDGGRNIDDVKTRGIGGQSF